MSIFGEYRFPIRRLRKPLCPRRQRAQRRRSGTSLLREQSRNLISPTDNIMSRYGIDVPLPPEIQRRSGPTPVILPWSEETQPVSRFTDSQWAAIVASDYIERTPIRRERSMTLDISVDGPPGISFELRRFRDTLTANSNVQPSYKIKCPLCRVENELDRNFGEHKMIATTEACCACTEDKSTVYFKSCGHIPYCVRCAFQQINLSPDNV